MHDLENRAGAAPDLVDLSMPLARNWRSMLVVPVCAALIGYGATYLIKPTFRATTTFLPPQQQQSGIASALASLGAVAGLAGGGAIKSPADEYVSLMQSVTVGDRLIDRFKLMQVYDVRYREQARKALAKASTIVAGKKDGLITVEVEDHDPERAAAIANQYVDELRRLTSTLAVSEAQQRRMFFETQLEDTKRKLTQAQIALQSSGFNPGALKTAPQAAADTYAKARAELAAAEVRLQTLRSSLTDNSPQVLQASANAAALREQVRQLEQSDPDNAKGPDYITKYREFKYQETLFDLLAKQYESAKFDEAREGALIQVVDTAKPPERKVKPQRVIDGVVTGFVAGALYLLYLLMRDRWNAGASDPVEAARRAALRDAFRGQSQRG
jgi:uncharacterized protein involved in exopolysaccharide biosynthesis